MKKYQTFFLSENFHFFFFFFFFLEVKFSIYLNWHDFVMILSNNFISGRRRSEEWLSVDPQGEVAHHLPHLP